jgi:hypothetical protein
MQGSIDQIEAFILEETLSNGPNLNQYRTFTVRRKAAKRILPWDLLADEILQLVLPRPQDENLPSTTDEPARKTASPDVQVGLSPPAAGRGDANTLTLCRSSRQKAWIPAEDAKLKDAVEKHGKDCWTVVAAMVPG